MSMKWPEPMPEIGRLPDSTLAWMRGVCLVMDPKTSCPQTLHVTLFFDGTNNNDDITNPWRDSKSRTHTNVARLFNAAVADEDHGMFPFYIPGVGTPFSKIGEPLYSTDGKAFASGFGARCVWGYTRVLNAVYSAIASDKTRTLIPDEVAKRLCAAGANGDMAGFGEPVQRLSVAHQRSTSFQYAIASCEANSVSLWASI